MRIFNSTYENNIFDKIIRWSHIEKGIKPSGSIGPISLLVRYKLAQLTCLVDNVHFMFLEHLVFKA